jgi:hypothetical protein
MTRTPIRRVAFVSVAALLAAVPMARALGQFAILGVATTHTVGVEAHDLPGEWKDETWRRVVWRIERGENPDEFRAIRVRKDKEAERYRGVLVHLKAREDFLDLTPDKGPRPDGPAPHLLLKLEMVRSDGVSIGTPPRVRKEFDGHLAKSYYRLQLIPPRPSSLRDDLRKEFKDLTGHVRPGPGDDLLVIADRDRVTRLLAEHANDPAFWKTSRDVPIVVKRRSDNED